MLDEIDHIGIAVENLESVLDTFRTGFNMAPAFEEEVPDQQVRVAGFHVGSSTVEYLEPMNPESPIAKFLQKKGTGIHHIAFRVANLNEALTELKKKGFRLIDEIPRTGAAGNQIAFIHPKSTNGILIELCEI